MKKLILAVVLLAVLVGTPAFAATTNPKANANAKKTSAQTQTETITTLHAELKALKEQRRGLLSTLITQIRQGAKSDAVTTLQTILSLDPSVYPQGLVTGYYGPLTSAAVKKFQAKNGLEQVGFVGPRTAEKLKAFAEENELTADAGTGIGLKNKLCAIVPPGHMIAPGFLKKMGGVRPTLPTCQTLPPGIKAKLDSLPPTDPSDVTAPVISAVATTDLTAASVRVTWTTNESSKSQVWYGTTNPLVTGSATSVTDNTLVTSHSVTIPGLTANTVYYFIVGSTDANANAAVGTQGTFTTLTTDTTDPNISNLDESDLTATGVKITWTTNEVATDKIWYGTTDPVSTAGVPNMTDATLDTAHSLTLTSLTANTQYYYIVSSTDSSGNDTMSSQGTFTTLVADTTGPVISDLDESDVTATGAKINWTTNENATDKLWYGTTSPVSTAGAPNMTDATLDTSHTFTVTSLTAGTVYYYIVSSTDSSTNATLSAQGTFTTLP